MSGPEGSVHRTFYQLPAASESASEPASELPGPPQPGEAETLLQYVRDQTIGRGRSFLGPFGSNTAVYCDHTASGKSLRFIEDYSATRLLPTYANTHTTSTHSALQTTSFRDEARLIVRNSVQASEHDAVIFCGSGATAAVHKLIRLLQLRQPPTVLVGPHEHHSNLLPWRECAAEVVRVAEDPVTGGVSLSDLETQLARYPATPDRPLVACFSGASNVTGLLANDAELTAAVHRHGGLAVWDYATAAPYTRLAMNPVVPGLDAGLTQKDALLFSPHKLIGGVQTPGVLVVKKRLVRNPVPDGGGGGTVFFVRRHQHRYLQDVESREEGGTPGIVESVRAGLVLQLKEALGPERIRVWDDAIVSWRFWVRAGPGACARLPVFSFLVATPSGGFLHHNFVTALLNDLFGVQARGGCACAGPYAQDLLGIDETLAARFEQVLVEDSRLDRTHLRRQGEYSSYELLRPGFTRLTLSYLLSEEELDHVITALRLACEHGWKLLPQYRVNPETGEWRHHSNLVLKERRWLGDIKYAEGRMEVRRRECHEPPPSLADIRTRALKHIDNARKNCPRQVPDHGAVFDAAAAELRWFLLPNEAKLMLHNTPVQLTPPFKPRVYSSHAPRSALVRRRALSESGPSEDAARKPRAAGDTPATPAPSPASPSSPASPAATAVCAGQLYSGSLDRERGRAARAAAATAAAAVAASAPTGSPLRHQHLKQRAMSVSCSTDRRLSDTRFLAQELANLFSSGQRTPPPPPATVMRRMGSVGQIVPPAAVVNAAIRRIVSAGQVPAPAGEATPRRSSPDGAEAGAAASPEGASLAVLRRQASLSPVPPARPSPRTTPLTSPVERTPAPGTGLSAAGRVTPGEIPSPRSSGGCGGGDWKPCDPGTNLVSDGRGVPVINAAPLTVTTSTDKPSPVTNSEHKRPAVTNGEDKQPLVVNTGGSWSSGTNIEQKPPRMIQSEDKQPPVTSNEDRQSAVTNSESRRPPVTNSENGQTPVTNSENRQFPVTSREEKRPLLTNSEDVQFPVANGENQQSPVTSSDCPPDTGANNSDSAVGSSREESPVTLCTVSVVTDVNDVSGSPVAKSDSAVTNSDSAVTNSDSSVTNSDSSVTNSDSAVTNSDSAVTNSDRSVTVVSSAGSPVTTVGVSDRRDSDCRLGGGESSDTVLTCSVTHENSVSTSSSHDDSRNVSNERDINRAKQSKGSDKQTAENVQKKAAESLGPKWHAPPRSLYKKAAEAMAEFSMLRPGDRVLVCLSGGKDSLSLLHVLRQHQFVAAAAGAPFQLAAVTVDPQSSAYDPRPLVPYLAKLGVPYFYEVQGILQLAEAVDCSSICSFCSRMKRGRLYAAARRQGYNVLAFGQHLDDISESFLMSVFHNGRLRTMKACYTVKEEDLRVIRPLIYVREKELRHFAESRKLPVIPENCPACFEEPKERHRVKQLLAQQEVLFPRLFESLRSAMRPMYAISRTGVESRLFGRATDDDDDDDDDFSAGEVTCGIGGGDGCPEKSAGPT